MEHSRRLSLGSSVMLNKEKIEKLFFQQPRLLFITVKGPGSWQKIGKVNDLIRRVSDTYFIVRELNKEIDGYHFHAIVSQRKDIKPNWFRKGIHINVQNIGDKKGHKPNIPECEAEVNIRKYGSVDVPDGDDRIIADHINSAIQKKRADTRKNVKYSHLTRTLEYMYKELMVPIPFDNVIIKDPGGSMSDFLNRSHRERDGEGRVSADNTPQGSECSSDFGR